MHRCDTIPLVTVERSNFLAVANDNHAPYTIAEQSSNNSVALGPRVRVIGNARDLFDVQSGLRPRTSSRRISALRNGERLLGLWRMFAAKTNENELLQFLVPVDSEVTEIHRLRVLS